VRQAGASQRAAGALDRGEDAVALSGVPAADPEERELTRVFYFFKKGADTVTCEVRTSASGPGYDIIIIEPGGEVRTETHPTSEAVHKRWLEILERFQREGWWGPHIQDGRT